MAVESVRVVLSMLLLDWLRQFPELQLGDAAKLVVLILMLLMAMVPR